MKLFKATIQLDAMIAANSKEEAISVALNQIQLIFDNERDYADVTAVEVKELHDPQWKLSIPYSQGNIGEQCCQDILDSQNG